MPNSFAEFVGPMAIIGVVVLAVLVLVLWIFLPFAIFGLKPLLRKLAASSATRDEALLAEFRKITLALHKLHKEAQRSDPAASGPAKDTLAPSALPLNADNP